MRGVGGCQYCVFDFGGFGKEHSEMEMDLEVKVGETRTGTEKDEDDVFVTEVGESCVEWVEVSGRLTEFGDGEGGVESEGSSRGGVGRAVEDEVGAGLVSFESTTVANGVLIWFVVDTGIPGVEEVCGGAETELHDGPFFVGP